MIRLPFLWLATAFLFPLVARAERFDLGTHGELEMALPATWTAKGETGDRGFTISLQSVKAAEVTCKISLRFFKPELAVGPEEVQKRFGSLLERSTPPLFKRSGEIKAFKLKAGVGFYASLVEEKPAGDHAKAVTSGLVQFPNACVVTLTVFTESHQTAELAEAIQIFESLAFTEKGAGE